MKNILLSSMIAALCLASVQDADAVLFRQRQIQQEQKTNAGSIDITHLPGTGVNPEIFAKAVVAQHGSSATAIKQYFDKYWGSNASWSGINTYKQKIRAIANAAATYSTNPEALTTAITNFSEHCAGKQMAKYRHHCKAALEIFKILEVPPYNVPAIRSQFNSITVRE